MKKTIIMIVLVLSASTSWAGAPEYWRNRTYNDRIPWGGFIYQDQLHWRDRLYLDRVRTENHQHELEIEQIRAKVTIEQIRAEAAIEIAEQLRQSGNCHDPRLELYINEITEQ